MRTNSNKLNAQRIFQLVRLFRMPSILVACRVAGAVSGMLASLLLSRYYGAAQFGLIAQALSLTMVMSIFCTLNIEAGSPRFMIAAIRKGNLLSARNYASFNFRIWAVMSALCCLTVALWIWLQNGFISPLYLGAIIVAPLVGLTRIFAGLAMGFSKVFLAVIPRSFMRQFLFLFGVIGITFMVGSAPVFWVLIAFGVANIGVGFLQYKSLRPLMNNLLHQGGNGGAVYTEWQQWIKLGTIIGSSVLFIEFNQYFSVLLAGLTLSNIDVALLDIALKIIGFVSFSIIAINQSYLPRITQAFAVNDLAQVQAYLNQSGLIRLWVTMVIVAIFILAAPYILALFGPAFIDARPLFLLLLGIPILMAIFGPAQQILSLIKRPSLLAILAGIAVVLLCAGVIIGGASGGGIGAAMGVLISWVFWTVAGVFLVHRETGLNTSVFAAFGKITKGGS